jgi:hypothetical protein
MRIATVTHRDLVKDLTNPLGLPYPAEGVQCSSMKGATVEIPVSVLESVDTLDELEDWLTVRNVRIMRELRQARKDDLAGKFKRWQPRVLEWPRKSK